MDVLGWLWWLTTSFVGLVWSLAWFLLGGWVITLAQIGVIVLAVFGYKYGWRRSPQEIITRLGTFGRFVWSWVRAREVPPRPESRHTGRSAARSRRGPRQREPGDIHINVSTLLTVLMIAGLALLAML
jgi:hypothetical protein